MSASTINNDELAAFVTSTLNAIAIGVADAISESHHFSMPSKVAFEVAIKAMRSTQAGGGLKLQVFAAEGKRASNDEEISRVSFEVGTSSKAASRKLDLSRVGVR